MPFMKVDEIIVRNRHRKVDPEKVKHIAQSIDQTSLINPIIVNKKTLVAGAHRLEAFKLLGEKEISCHMMGVNGDDDLLSLIEIDENLCRNELSEAERSQHIALRVEIIARRNLPKAKEEVKSNYRGQRQDVELSDKVRQKVQQGAERKALADAKKEVGEILGINPTHVTAAINNHKAVSELGLDQNELEGLKGARYNEVARVARAEKKGNVEKGAAKAELKRQVEKPEREHSKSHDSDAMILVDLKTLRAAKSVLNKHRGTGVCAISEAYYAMDEAIEAIKKKPSKQD